MDTPVHASRRSDTTKANKAPFLLYGGKVQVFGQVHLYGRLKVLNLVCLSGGGQGGYGMPICYQVMISFCCKGWPVNRWAGGTFEFKYGKCACCGWGNVDCLLMAMPVANGLLENPPEISEGQRQFAWPLSLVVLLAKFTYSTVSVG